MPSLRDPSQIRRLLETDRPWAAYALGDLSPRLFEHCDWFGRSDGSPALLLLYRGFGVPVLFTLGEPSAVEDLLDESGPPRELYLQVHPDIVPVIQARYEVAQEKAMWRMLLDPDAYRPIVSEGGARLGPRDVTALRGLYADGEPGGETPGFFTPEMLMEGVYFGIWEREQLIAAAGTHVVMAQEGVAAIGNVYTRRNRRGHGLAKLVTSAVTAELLRVGVKTIALNVEQRNTAAIRVDERLGFVRYCSFHEGLATLRNE